MDCWNRRWCWYAEKVDIASSPSSTKPSLPKPPHTKLEDLPQHLIEVILKYLSLAELIRASLVCRSWKSIVESYLPHCQLPWLEFNNDAKEDIQKLKFFDMLDRRIYKIVYPNRQGCRISCRGSCKGWLIMMEESRSMFLINLLTFSEIQLPPLQTSRHHALLPGQAPCIICKVALSSAPAPHGDNHSCMLAALDNNGFLFYCNLGDESWSVFHEKDDKQLHYTFTEILFDEQKLYAIRNSGKLIVFYLHTQSIEAKYCINPPQHYCLDLSRMRYLLDYVHLRFLTCTMCLAEYNGDVFMVIARYWKRLPRAEDAEYETIVWFDEKWYEFFKLDRKASRWVEVESMHDKILFLDSHGIIFLSASDFPSMHGNCVYFPYYIGGRMLSKNVTLNDYELRVLHLEDHRIETCCYFQSISRPHWFFPSIN